MSKKIINVILFGLFLAGCTNINQADKIINTPKVPPIPPTPVAPIINDRPEAFCGNSTEGFCHQDADCQTFGCSGQICGSRFEEELVSTCVWRECYDETDYSLICGCLNQKCQWYK